MEHTPMQNTHALVSVASSVAEPDFVQYTMIIDVNNHKYIELNKTGIPSRSDAEPQDQRASWRETRRPRATPASGRPLG